MTSAIIRTSVRPGQICSICQDKQCIPRKGKKFRRWAIHDGVSGSKHPMHLTCLIRSISTKISAFKCPQCRERVMSPIDSHDPHDKSKKTIRAVYEKLLMEQPDSDTSSDSSLDFSESLDGASADSDYQDEALEDRSSPHRGLEVNTSEAERLPSIEELRQGADVVMRETRRLLDLFLHSRQQR